ncbi:hypothetical protein LCGC14_0903520 [marine sediment metagenome]|uniref:CMP/dCMP-type deaminase domain-containing protein n=1 Tax=marine sediment metagenome TaxID=412755 RepID=A0A0F9S2J7_9ZZZZ
MNSQTRWDLDYLALAKFWAERKSKDPSTQVGAVLVSPDNTQVILAYNGFPQGMDDNPVLYNNRNVKLSRTIHAELNAIILSRRDLRNYTIYTWPFPPCDKCALHVIQAGIKRVVALRPTLEQKKRWGAQFEIAYISFREADVVIKLYRGDEL